MALYLQLVITDIDILPECQEQPLPREVMCIIRGMNQSSKVPHSQITMLLLSTVPQRNIDGEEDVQLSSLSPLPLTVTGSKP